MRRLVLAFMMVAGACNGQDPASVEGDVNAVEAANAAAPEHMPVLLRYKPADQGGPDTFRAAIVHGVLDFAGPCVRLQDQSGRLATVVSTAGAQLMHDDAGPYWPSHFERLRHGSSITGGGGEISGLPPGDLLDGPVPDACRAGPAIELYDVRRPPERPPAPGGPAPRPPAD